MFQSSRIAAFSPLLSFYSIEVELVVVLDIYKSSFEEKSDVDKKIY